ncbi:MAG: CHAT domain-containing protein [Bacteroidota bacterium]
MRITLASLFLLLNSLQIFAQEQTIPQHPNITDANGMRQGWWSIELDDDFMRPLTKNDVKFYRVIEFKDDKPVGVTKIYFPSGVLHQELTLLSYRPSDKRSYMEKIDYTQPYHVYWEDGSENLIAQNRIQCEMLMMQGKYELALPLVKKERDNQRVCYALNLDRGDNDLSELPATRTEVENIAGIMTAKGWQPEVLVGEKALEETLKDCFKPRVLHIATHGFFQPDATVDQNPLLRSGLMLTGAGKTLEGDKDDKTEDGGDYHEVGII